jgi:hypothetical protein
MTMFFDDAATGFVGTAGSIVLRAFDWEGPSAKEPSSDGECMLPTSPTHTRSTRLHGKLFSIEQPIP